MDSETLVRRVREEFREMPGLRLTVAQATRLQRMCAHSPPRCAVSRRTSAWPRAAR
jgi:hypothetical protein